MEDFSTKTIQETEVTLKTSCTTGIPGDAEDIKERVSKFGINKLSPQKKVSIFKQLYEKLTETMILILFFACVVSFILAEYLDATGVAIAIMISSCIGIYMDGRGSKAIEALNNIASNILVKVFRRGKVDQVKSEEVYVGDLIELNAGDKVPADGRLVEVEDLEVDESMFTGETLPVKKNVDTFKEVPPLADKKNYAHSGSYVSTGRGKFLVTGIGDNTEMGKIANELRGAGDVETSMQIKLKEFGKKLSIVCTILTAFLFVYTLIRSGDYSLASVKDSFEVSIAMIVAAVPEGLPTMIALTYAFKAIEMKDKNALVRKISACETIGSVSYICSDKTGTLTQNKMTVVKLYTEGNLIEPSKITNGNLIRNMALNTTAELIEDEEGVKDVGGASEAALLRCLRSAGEKYSEIRATFPVAKLIEFNSDRKMMSTVVKTGGEFPYIVYTKGAPERVLDRCNFIELEGDRVERLTPEIRKSIEEKIIEFQSQAMRVLAFAQAMGDDIEELAREERLTFTGFVGIEDPVRPDVKDAVAQCHAAGIGVVMLTGDHLHTAKAIANQLGMISSDSLIFEASQIDAMPDEDLKKIIHKIVVVARSTPSTKKRFVETLQQLGESVAVTGDGVNDAPALKAADVGIAMGSGTEVSKAASKIVVLDDSFSTIVTGVKWGRSIYQNIQRFIVFQLTVNVVAFFTAFASTIMGFPLPFTTLQLLFVNLIMDGPPALSLGLEPARDALMNNKPIKKSASIITKDMLKKIGLNGAYISLSILALMKYEFLGGSPEMQSTIIFSVFVFFQLWNAFNSREFGYDSIIPNFTKNRTALTLVGGAGLAQILIAQYAGMFFSTVPLPITMWATIIAYTFSVVIFSEVIKVIASMVMPSKAGVTQES